MASLETLIYGPGDAIGNNKGLIPYLIDRHVTDFERFNVRPYSFQSPNAFDPSAGGTGIRIANPAPFNATDREAIAGGLIMRKEIRLGRILEAQPNLTEWEITVNDLYDRIAASIVHWSQCHAQTPIPNGAEYSGGAMERVAATNVASVRSRSVWHVLVWVVKVAHDVD